MKANIRKMLHMTERLSFKLFTPKQREWVKDHLTDKQKFYIKKLLFSGKWQRSEVNQVKHRLYNLGFTRRALVDLEALCTRQNEPYLNRLARWEMALWYANQYSKESAEKCITILEQAIKDEVDTNRLRQAAIMKAECHEILGNRSEAKKLLDEALAMEEHPDLFLAYANLETDSELRLIWINRSLQMCGVPHVSLSRGKGTKLDYDRLQSEERRAHTNDNREQDPKVSVIMPVYNAEDVIKTSIQSILSQTWRNLELFVVDDCSQDNTVSIVQKFTEQDSRVKLLQAETNGGAYMARNLALKQVTGDFITVNDADDWSHVEKIRTQTEHLIANPTVIGNTSEQARMTNELKLYRRGKPGTYIFSNMSSFLFRREPVLGDIGYWDSVRFAADSEFIRRIKKVYGEKSVVPLKTGPLSFQRQTSGSLTGNSAFGYHGFKMGVRREYEESHDYYHDTTNDLYLSFPLTNRLFSAPEPMWPEKEAKSEGFRLFDIVIAFDFRQAEEQIAPIIKEIEAFENKGYRVALLQLFTYELSPDKKVNPLIRKLLNQSKVEMVCYGERVQSNVLVFRDSNILTDWQKYRPLIVTDKVSVVKNESLINSFSVEASLISEYVEGDFKCSWYPKNNDVRKKLIEQIELTDEKVEIASENWSQEAMLFE
ncbi:glycosyltransferase family A protein [Halalkalibacter sp. APA_J-10(15)]|uniref:glycosyltransferase family A protein n=1 Tax=Halalkalibacter sp. APA_J-10(15) TaxID=2933805 RepID=UPI001FF69B4B|nr:glycosyltransferase family A protein [Halalkalibacter sp. APA_J-10(15)]MCK0470257.1 glycosyltransferase [Halalkalibacter sp. APA_J-10(15)]